MNRGIFVVALIISYVLTYSPIVSAETSNENRTVAESLNEQIEADAEELVESEGQIIVEERPNIEQRPFLLFVQLFGALLFVIVLIYLLLRFINKRSRSYRSTQALQNLGGVPLGSNRSVQLVKVGDRLLVVGVGETIQLLKEIEQKDEIDELLKQQEQQFESFEQPFVSYVQRFINERKEKSKQQPDSSFQEVFKTKLNDVKESQQQLREVIRERDK